MGARHDQPPHERTAPPRARGPSARPGSGPASGGVGLSPGLRIEPRLGVLRHVEAAGRRVARGLTRLASGARIATAADDPAGLGVAERLRVRSASLAMARRNAEQGLDLVRGAEAALGEFSRTLLRLRELAVRAANGTLDPGDRAILASEWDGLTGELVRQARAAEPGGLGLPTAGRRIPLQVGAAAGEVVWVELADARPLATLVRRVGPPRVPRTGAVRRSLATLDRALGWVAGQRAKLGTAERRLGHATAALAQGVLELESATSRLGDADLAVELAELVAARLTQVAGLALLTQANREGALVLELLRALPPPAQAAAAPGSQSEGPEGSAGAIGSAGGGGGTPTPAGGPRGAHGGRGPAGGAGRRPRARNGLPPGFQERMARFGAARPDG